MILFTTRIQIVILPSDCNTFTCKSNTRKCVCECLVFNQRTPIPDKLVSSNNLFARYHTGIARSHIKRTHRTFALQR